MFLVIGYVILKVSYMVRYFIYGNILDLVVFVVGKYVSFLIG